MPGTSPKTVFQFYAKAHYETLYVSHFQINDSGVYPKNAPAKYLKIYPKLHGPSKKWLNGSEPLGPKLICKV